MKLMSIFVDETTYEGLHSICYKGSKSEYDLVFDKWNDVAFIRKYCMDNLDYLQSGIYGNITLAEAISEIRQEVLEITDVINSTEKWDGLFQPLNDNEYDTRELSKRKIKLKNNRFRKSKLRLYAIKLTDNTFVVTGGAIKVTHKMEDHNDTKDEFEKNSRVRDWLKEKGIYIEDDLIYYYEEEQ